ncbi:hypothetical protein MACH09_38380 [Vibrio sp. MACH09]|uniref:YaeQ family protein n=1 Tax=Vibrio sp. MACH09 TaxID=3025122 RepID=UPI00278EE0CA|nr:YaeQ family protein [Vibrio sp. MACH09]GLO63330.1 hypothetical protein MACH09_38380 [Vibrio sp. MACH09]
MALKPTIFKFRIALTDLNRDYYDSISLTTALHPSETHQRMMTRVLAYCLNASPELTFTKGLSTIEEPDIWCKTLDDQLQLWIDIGEPDPERVKKSTRLAKKVLIYSFNSKSSVWWTQNSAKLNMLDASVFQFDHSEISQLAELIERTMDISVMLTGNSAYISAAKGECEVTWQTLKE